MTDMCQDFSWLNPSPVFFGFTILIDESVEPNMVEIRHGPPEMKMRSETWNKLKESFKDD